MNKRKIPGLVLLLSFSLVIGGCAGYTHPVLAPAQVKTAPAPAPAVVAAPAVREPVVEPESREVSGLELTIRQAIDQARATMKTVRISHGDLLVEVNPMWDFNYQGRVHVWIYSADGGLIREEYRD
ncbi:MAG: hypothetical protein L3J03_09425 [Desulfobacterales bacterium]|nr:hypothetical protein [Desulfobacterales bacterium]